VKVTPRRMSFYVLVVCVTAAIGFPIYWMLITSVKTTAEMFSSPPSLFPRSFDFTKYIDLYEDGRIFLWIKNSFLVALGTVLFNLFCAIPAAYAIAKLRLRFAGGLLLLVLITQLLPPMLIIVPLYYIFSNVGLIDTHIALVLSNSVLTLPFSTWILTGFFEKVPNEIRDAALIDGCSNFAVFYRVMLPITKPILLTVALITFFDAWNEYLFASTFITKQARWVGTAGLASFIGEHGISWRMLLANSAVFALVPMIIYLIFRRTIVKGIAEGFTSK